jgi:hypothetical protein
MPINSSKWKKDKLDQNSDALSRRWQLVSETANAGESTGFLFGFFGSGDWLGVARGNETSYSPSSRCSELKCLIRCMKTRKY